MIPADDAYEVPGADDPAIFSAIISQSLSEQVYIAGELDKINQQAEQETGSSFAELTPEQQMALAEQIGLGSPFFRLLSVIAVQCYYMDDRVLTSLEFEARPPFPQGHQIEQGDWSLLDPVKAMPRRWRETD